jgi:hypothetical protein
VFTSCSLHIEVTQSLWYHHIITVKINSMLVSASDYNSAKFRSLSFILTNIRQNIPFFFFRRSRVCHRITHSFSLHLFVIFARTVCLCTGWYIRAVIKAGELTSRSSKRPTHYEARWTSRSTCTGEYSGHGLKPTASQRLASTLRMRRKIPPSPSIYVTLYQAHRKIRLYFQVTSY